MTRAVPDLSLVVLAWNEEASVVGFLEESLAWLDGLPGSHEILVVDDGSTDQTADRALEVAARDRRVRVHRHERNQGMGAGMRTGFQNARGDYVSILAADGQVPARALEELLPALDAADIVLSVYSRRPGELYRVGLSVGMRLMMRALLGITFRLEGIYLFPTRVATEEVGLDLVGATTFFFSFELIARALALGHTATTVTIAPLPRQHGASKVANLRRIRRVAGELARFRWRLVKEGRATLRA